MTYIYHAPILTVDGVVFQLIDGKLAVLLIRRAAEPFKGEWALPGGYIAAGDTTLQALDRVLTSKAGISPGDLALVEQLYTFDTVTRDPRGPSVSVTYMGLCRDITPAPSKTTQEPTFYPVDALPKLAYDHASIIAYALDRLRAKAGYTTMLYALLPKQFTLSQLQAAYEAVLGNALDKRNFRKKFLALNVLAATDEYHQEGAHRPALLYRFKQQKQQPLERSF